MKITTPGFGLLSMDAGTLELTDNGVSINKKTSFSIPYANITAVHLDPGGFLSQAFIQILGGGDRQMTDGHLAQGHPSCLGFKSNQLEDFKKAKAEIERRISAAHQKQPSETVSVADEIRKLAQLLNEGLLTQAEFDGKKKQLLGI